MSPTRETIVVNAVFAPTGKWVRLVKLLVARLSDGVVIETPEGYSGLAFSIQSVDVRIVLEELRRRGFEVTTFHIEPIREPSA